MKLRIFKTLVIVVFAYWLIGTLANSAFAQSTNTLTPPTTYRSSDNPFYWKNRSPYPGYWQQDVHYAIKASIDEKKDIIDGKLKLTYWNNSPDTLHEVFFHLYENAVQPGSYYDELHKQNKLKPKYGKYEAQKLGTPIQSFTHEEKDLQIELDNTIFRVQLDKPIFPNDSTFFEIEFKTYFDIEGTIRRRNKVYEAYGYKHYNGVHWYPIICVYDAKFGWTTDQHLGREFYANFGTFDAELTFANNFIVEATGNLVNREEVLPNDLREKLDIKNFANKPLEETPSVIVSYDSTIRKTWKYHAENVHNFAFTADPTYRIGEKTWNGIKCIALVQEPHASRWQTVADYTAKCVEIYSRDFGMYGYPKLVVADANDGMEYPMLTLCGGLEPSNHATIAHEVGHNWFYGIIGSNETYRAFLDEGFTQFIETRALEKLKGKYVPMSPQKSKYKKKFKEQVDYRTTYVYWGYLADATKNEDAFLNTHSDGFHGAIRQGGGYRHVYMKTATMLYNLQYVLGDSLFTQAMLHYFNQWKFCHPYPEDFRNSIIQFTGVDLNWFFDQWLETVKNVDYRVMKVKRAKTVNSPQSTDDSMKPVDSGLSSVDSTSDIKLQTSNYQITLKRKGRMQMPLDLMVTTKNNDTLYYHIPNQWFVKETNATILPKWHGWDKLYPTYTATISLPAKIDRVVIDPTNRLADVYMPDNAKSRNIILKFDSKVSNSPDWKNYRMYWRPALWWNAYDGLKLGANLNGNFLNYKHRFSLTVMGSTKLGQGDPERFDFPSEDKSKFDKFNYRFDYSTSMDKLVKNSNVFITTMYWEGYEQYKFGFDVTVGKKNTQFMLYMKMMNKPRESKLNYLLYPGEWEAPNLINNTVNVELNQPYTKTKASGKFNLTLRSNAIGTDFDYHYLQITHINSLKFWRLELRSRVFGRFGTGSNQASMSALYFAQANNEEMMDNPFTRSRGYFPQVWVGSFGNDVNHFHHGGGLNVRGYAGYLLVEDEDGQAFPAYKGNSGGSFNAELDLDGIVKWKPKKLSDYVHLDFYVFADGGFIVYDKGNGDEAFSNFRTDAGAGAALTIKKWGWFETLKPLTIRFDVPFYLSHAPFASPDNFDFRFVMGVGRAF
ncbi:MAG: M1 family metallopeptidase [Chitinophagales bacterium]|nr:M1 family metallopeptidase [Chitinophagales bacterium]